MQDTPESLYFLIKSQIAVNLTGKWVPHYSFSAPYRSQAYPSESNNNRNETEPEMQELKYKSNSLYESNFLTQLPCVSLRIICRKNKQGISLTVAFYYAQKRQLSLKLPRLQSV
jgi:hypothetical protein